MLEEIGGKSEDILKNSVDLLRRLMQNYEEVGREIVALIGTYGLYRAALTAATYHTTLFRRTQVALIATSKKLFAAMAANPYTAIAAAVAAVGYGIYKVVGSESDFEKITKAVVKAVSDFNGTMAS